MSGDLERSSLGTRGARSLRSRTPTSTVRTIVGRVSEDALRQPLAERLANGLLGLIIYGEGSLKPQADSGSGSPSFVVGPDREPCWQCGEPTRLVDICFEAFICSHPCFVKAVDDYYEAMAAADARMRPNCEYCERGVSADGEPTRFCTGLCPEQPQTDGPF